MRCGVAGSPIAHSLSPVLHRAAYAALGLDWTYDAHDVDEQALPGFIGALGPPWRGVSLTMPLKQAALAHCTDLSDTARRVSAVNTLMVESNGRRSGHNTDVPGLVAAWREAGFVSVHAGGEARAGFGAVAVLGAGATARSAVAALALVGAARVTVLARSPERAGELRTLLGALALEGAVVPLAGPPSGLPMRSELLVSTVPAAAQRDLVAASAVQEAMAGATAFFDVAYGPRPTALLDAARAAGVPCADGFSLLLHQAALQVRLMTGCSVVPLEAMRSAGEAALLRDRVATEPGAAASLEV